MPGWLLALTHQNSKLTKHIIIKTHHHTHFSLCAGLYFSIHDILWAKRVEACFTVLYSVHRGLCGVDKARQGRQGRQALQDSEQRVWWSPTLPYL